MHKTNYHSASQRTRDSCPRRGSWFDCTLAWEERKEKTKEKEEKQRSRKAGTSITLRHANLGHRVHLLPFSLPSTLFFCHEWKGTLATSFKRWGVQTLSLLPMSTLRPSYWEELGMPKSSQGIPVTFQGALLSLHPKKSPFFRPSHITAWDSCHPAAPPPNAFELTGFAKSQGMEPFSMVEEFLASQSRTNVGFWKPALFVQLIRTPQGLSELVVSWGVVWGPGKSVTVCSLSGRNTYQTTVPHQMQAGTQGSRVACFHLGPRW